MQQRLIILGLILMANPLQAKNNKTVEEKVAKVFSTYVEKSCNSVLITRTDTRESSTEGALVEFRTIVHCNNKPLLSITNTRTYDQYTTGMSTAYYTTTFAESQTEQFHQDDLKTIGAIRFQNLATQAVESLDYVKVQPSTPNVHVQSDEEKSFEVKFERKNKATVSDDSI